MSLGVEESVKSESLLKLGLFMPACCKRSLAAGVFTNPFTVKYRSCSVNKNRNIVSIVRQKDDEDTLELTIKRRCQIWYVDV